MAPLPLNPEPSRPEERAEKHLLQKSYVDAAIENLGSETEKESNNRSQYIGQGEDDAPRSPVRKPHKRNGSVRSNGALKHKRSDSSFLVQDYADRDGEKLTSVKPFDFEESLVLARKEMPVTKRHKGEPELVSGRQAGAGWERSGFA